MSATHFPTSVDFHLPRRQTRDQATAIAAPSYESFTTRFGTAFPKPVFLESDLGSTAVYELSPPSGRSKRPVLMLHGLNTPALGLWPLAKELQALDPDAHIVLFDLWGHGISSTPLVAHTPHIFHFQIFQVLSFMRWNAAHLIGYSFGASTTVSFVLDNPQAALSAVVIGPAGLLQMDNFDQHMQGLLKDSEGRETEAIDCVLAWLEGGPLVLPSDWQQRAKSGEVIAEAFREWELQEHSGYPHSILSMFRDGGVYDKHSLFRRLAKLPLKKLAVLGEADPVCSKSQLVELGLTDIEVVAEADHGLVRSKKDEIARILNYFWTKQD